MKLAECIGNGCWTMPLQFGTFSSLRLILLTHFLPRSQSFTALKHTASCTAVHHPLNALASINVVALRQTRLVLGWVTVCGRVNHLGM